MSTVERVRCYCGGVGVVVAGVMSCNRCTAAGRKGAPWPGDYYQKTGLFDRSREFNLSRNRQGRNRHPQPAGRWRDTHSPQEIDSRTEMYGNLVLTDRGELAELADLYGLRKFALVGTGDGAFANDLMERSARLFVYCIDEWPDDNVKGMAFKRLSRFGDRVQVLVHPSVVACDRVQGQVDVAYLSDPPTRDACTLDLNVWWAKVRTGGILAGHRFEREHVRDAVRDFARRHDADVHLIRQDGEGLESSYYLWRR